MCVMGVACGEEWLDSDRDAIADACDACPYIFNPTQSPAPCQYREGVCPGVMEEAILWSATSSGSVDLKPCPPPLAGEPASQPAGKHGSCF